MGKISHFFKHPIVMNILIIFSLAIVLAFVSLKLLDIYTLHDKYVTVPDLKGMDMSNAAVILENSGLRYEITDSVFTNEVDPGKIFDVVPRVGQQVKPGRVLYITVNSLHTKPATIPDVTDMSFRQAMAQLKAAGFSSVSVKRVPGKFNDLVEGVTDISGKIIKSGSSLPIDCPLILLVISDTLSSGIISMDSLIELAPKEEPHKEGEEWF